MNARGQIPLRTANDRWPFARWVARRWRDWWGRRQAVAELDCCGEREMDRIAQDVGVPRGELCVLAGKWPDAAQELTRRMDRVGLDQDDVTAVEPQVVRDLQRVCSLCASKRRCEHDLLARPNDPVWQDYCPNAPTFFALLAERQKPAVSASAKQV